MIILEWFLEDLRLVFIFAVICIFILWHNLKMLGNVLGNTNYGKEKHVLVTGCDSGFGYEIALDLCKLKCKVYAACLTDNGIERLNKQKEFNGIAFLMDVRKDGDVEKARKLIEENTKGEGSYLNL